MRVSNTLGLYIRSGTIRVNYDHTNRGHSRFNLEMFSQTTCQPQVLAAVGQLTSVVSSARQGLLGSIHTHRTARVKRHKAASAVNTTSNDGDRAESLTTKVDPETKELVELFVVDVTRDLETLKKSLRLADKNYFGNVWKQSHVSKDTFFENRTGFSEELLMLPSQSQISALFHNQHVRRLLEQQSPFLYKEFTRGFKTKSSRQKAGLGKAKEEEDLIDELIRQKTGLGKAKELISKKFQALNPLSKSTKQKASIKTPDIGDNVFEAFARGYTVGQDAYKGQDSSSKKSKYKLSKRIIEIAIALLLLLLLIDIYRNRHKLRKMISVGPQAVDPELVTVVFDDVRGVDEAKQELIDVVEYLRNPGKFTSVGAVLPKGVLLVGQPGIGKTMLAKAVAGEAGVPFFYASGSEFDEVFAGSGARKVRNLFASAKARAPCVVFLDEIDSVGRKRTSSSMLPYANQTINQLLSEMDGFNSKEGVIVLGATNKRENLDKALLRPGRFDVEVQLMPADFKGRIEIFKLYLGRVSVDSSVDPEILARGSSGFTGADIQNMVNQAALKAGLDGMTQITTEHMEYARDKILMGTAWKNKRISMNTKWNTAYHEAGHTIVSHFTKDARPLRKVTILPRGHSLGHTSYTQDEEMEHSETRAMLLAEMDVAMGGRLGEELIFGREKVTTGARLDFLYATKIATRMVKKLGMSEKVGAHVCLGSEEKKLSAATKELIDSEIKRFLDESFERAKQILIAHATEHKLLAQALIDYETLEKEEVDQILKTQKPFKKTVNKSK